MARAKAKTPKVKIGDRFGKLVALEQIEMPITKKVLDKDNNYYKVPTGRTKVGWKCQCDCGRETEIPEITLLKETSTLRSCGKCKPEKNLNHANKANKDWDELYEYVRTKIMGYDKNQSLSRQMVARLKGLMSGKYMGNNKTANNADYSDKTILNTFKYCSPDIHKVLSYKTFNDEWVKFNYIAKIVENNINTVYMREKQAEKVKEEIEKINIDTSIYKNVEYKPKEKKAKDKFTDLW